MDYEEKLDVCYKEMQEEFGITERQAVRILNDLDIEDLVIEYYENEIRKAEEEKEADYKYNQAHYNDGWQDHIGG